jgi:hypothetical protein
MTVDIDMSLDYLVWERQATTVQYESVRHDAAPDKVVVFAHRRAISTRQLLAAQGAYTGSDLNWLIPAKPITSPFRPKAGDIITDEFEDAWTVLEPQFNKFRETHRLVCRNLALVYGLRDSIEIQEAVTITDGVGSIKRTEWVPIYQNLAARVQPTSAEPKTERGVEGQQTRYTVVVGRQLSLLNVRNCRILWEGKLLDLASYTMAEQISELPRIEAVGKA